MKYFQCRFEGDEATFLVIAESVYAAKCSFRMHLVDVLLVEFCVIQDIECLEIIVEDGVGVLPL